MRTLLMLSSPVTVTMPFCNGLIEVAGHQRDSRASIVGLKVCFLAGRFMISSRVAVGGRGVRVRFGSRLVGCELASTASPSTCLYGVCDRVSRESLLHGSRR